MKKVFLNKLKENWVVDRFRSEWYDHQSEFSANNIKDSEMLKTFNCGVGFCVIANKKNISQIKKHFSKDFKPYEIGFVSKTEPRINTFGKILW